MVEYTGLTPHEMELYEFGGRSDQVSYLVKYIMAHYGLSDRNQVYKAVGFCYKKYGFTSTVLGARLLDGVDSSSLFGKLVYSASPYAEAERNVVTMEQEGASVKAAASRKELDARLKEYRNVCALPMEDGLLKLKLSGKIDKTLDTENLSPEEYFDLVKDAYGIKDGVDDGSASGSCF